MGKRCEVKWNKEAFKRLNEDPKIQVYAHILINTHK